MRCINFTPLWSAENVNNFGRVFDKIFHYAITTYCPNFSGWLEMVELFLGGKGSWAMWFWRVSSSATCRLISLFLLLSFFALYFCCLVSSLVSSLASCNKKNIILIWTAMLRLGWLDSSSLKVWQYQRRNEKEITHSQIVYFMNNSKGLICIESTHTLLCVFTYCLSIDHHSRFLK